jgi:group II intron reverse transcriptase/maturase
MVNITAWKKIDWTRVQKSVTRVQHRIYKASLINDQGKVHFLQRKLINSINPKLLAVRKVTEVKKGKTTPGVDKILITTGEEKYKLATKLKLSNQADTIRRVWIPKPGKIEKRPLGIPTIEDRAKQALALFALEPEWEAKFEPNSYGFRPGRRCYDAISQIFKSLRQSPKFILDADISKCFDKINHAKLIAKLGTIPPLEIQIEAWLKADILDLSCRHQIDKEKPREGTPQGGIISPLLANIALHGIETAVKEYYANNLYQGSKTIAKRDRLQQVSLIRYADDFIITGPSLEIIQKLKDFTSEWLRTEAGLTLSEAKTQILDSRQGFEFLGFHMISIRTQDTYKFITNISKESKIKLLSKTREIVTANRACSTSDLILKLNPVILGWANYFKYCQCSKDFKQVEYSLFGQIRKWVFRRKSEGLRSKDDLKRKYFPLKEIKFKGRKHQHEWILSGKSIGRNGKEKEDFLIYPSWINSETYVKVKGNASPYDENHLYWTSRLINYEYYNTRVKKLLKLQQGKCAICELAFKNSDIIETDYIIPLIESGSDKMSNLQAIHQECHIIRTAVENLERSKKKKAKEDILSKT